MFKKIKKWIKKNKSFWSPPIRDINLSKINQDNVNYTLDHSIALLKEIDESGKALAKAATLLLSFLLPVIAALFFYIFKTIHDSKTLFLNLNSYKEPLIFISSGTLLIYILVSILVIFFCLIPRMLSTTYSQPKELLFDERMCCEDSIVLKLRSVVQMQHAITNNSNRNSRRLKILKLSLSALILAPIICVLIGGFYFQF